MNSKILNIQALRGIAVMLVLAFHLLSIESNYGHGYRLMSDYWIIGMSGVDLFFVISGFVMVTITGNQFQRSGVVRKFLFHRITRIYPLYWLFTLLALTVLLARPDMLKRGFEAHELLRALLLLPQNSLPLLMVGWTLIHEMYFYIVFSLLLLFPERRVPLLLLVWAGITAVCNLLMPTSAGAAVRLITHPLTLEFIVGGTVGLLINRGIARAGFACLIFGIASWLVGYAIHAYFGPIPSSWLRVFLFGLPMALMVYGLVVLETRHGKTLPNWMIGLGDASYSIYLSHVLVMGAIARIGVEFVQAGIPAIRPLVLAALILAAVAFGIACHRLIEMPLIRATRKMASFV